MQPPADAIMLRICNSRRLNSPFGNATGLQALLNTVGNAGRDSSPDTIDISTINALTKGSAHDVIAESKGLVGDLARAEVLAVEGSNEHGVGAIGIELGVDAALVEGGHLIGIERVENNPALAVFEDAVLWCHGGD